MWTTVCFCSQLPWYGGSFNKPGKLIMSLKIKNYKWRARSVTTASNQRSSRARRRLGFGVPLLHRTRAERPLLYPRCKQLYRRLPLVCFGFIVYCWLQGLLGRGGYSPLYKIPTPTPTTRPQLRAG